MAREFIQKTIYLRQEDEDKWNAVENKSEFIHVALNRSPKDTGPSTVPNNVGLLGINKPQVSKTIAVFCKHGADPRFCKHAKNGKKCK